MRYILYKDFSDNISCKVSFKASISCADTLLRFRDVLCFVGENGGGETPFKLQRTTTFYTTCPAGMCA